MSQQKQSAMNVVFIAFVTVGVLVGAFRGDLKGVTDSSLQAAKDGVTLALGLVGVMGFWLGMMKVLEAGGFLKTVAALVAPVMKRLFPDVPPTHPAMGAIVMNISANMLGLGNAATPFGIRAMMQLNRLNPIPGTATNAMCLFLAINTSSVTILPLGVIAVRAAAGSKLPAAIFLPSLLATIISTLAGIVVAVWFARRDRSYREELAKVSDQQIRDPKNEAGGDEVQLDECSHLRVDASLVSRICGYGALALFFGLLLRAVLLAEEKSRFLLNEISSFWLLPGLILTTVSFGLIRGVKVYEAVTEGAKQGFETAVKIIPFLIAILVSVALFRTSGAMETLSTALAPVTELIGMPPEAVPMAIVRPLSGTGAFGIFSAVVNHAPDSYPAFVVSVMNGASDTTFYILAVYFGSVGIVRFRHAVIAGLSADVVGMIAASLLSKVFWTPVV